MARMKYLVLHCTATPEGREVTSKEIRHWHTDPVSKGGRGWKQVGYTDLIHLDGKVERLVDNNEDAEVDPWEVTNGAKGYNSVSRHFIDSAFAFLMVARSVHIATMVATRPPPRRTFRTSLIFMPSIFLLLVYSY